MRKELAGLFLLAGLGVTQAEPPAARAINTLGLELLARVAPPAQSTLLSPYSIQVALAMTYVGAEGETRAEMARVLHYPKEGLADGFAELNTQLAALTAETKKLAEASKKHGGGASDPIQLEIANRLFGQKGYEFRPAFLETLKQKFEAPLELADFVKNADGARQRINTWVEERTRDRIKDLLPQGALNRDTRLVLVNAIYLKAPWAEVFQKDATKPAAFHLADGTTMEVPTMGTSARFGYDKRADYTVVTLPYVGGQLQFVILLPDAPDGLAALEKKLTPSLLADCAKIHAREVRLFLPKFKLEPPLFALGDTLQAMGMKSAFNRGANFNGMAPEPLAISQVFHKTFVAVDEQGTEAAAATAVVMMRMSLPVEAPPEVKVDRPFFFAIQHVPTGACLFLGRLSDPR